MTSLAPHGGDALGATPGHPLLTPALSGARDLSMSCQQAMLDLAAIQRIPGIAGYWPADPAYLFEDSAGTIPASVGGVVGCWWSLGPAAIQATTAVKPYLRKTPTSNVYWIDSNTATSALTATLGNLGASCTVARAGAEGVTFTEGVTISSTYNIAPVHGFNGDIAIFNRALTVTEKALLTRYMARGVPLLGSNLVTNGDFSNGLTGFTLASTAINNNGVGVLDVTSGPASNEIVNPFPVIISSEKSYLTQYDVLTGTDPTTILVRPVPNTHIAFDTLGHKSYAKIATSNATTGALLVMGANIRLVIDNLSIKEIL